MPAAKRAVKARAKKSTTKATTRVKVRKVAPKSKVTTKPIKTVKESFTKSELLSTLADRCELPKKDISKVFDELAVVIGGHVKKGGAGQFVLPGLLKIVIQNKKATKARKGINPFTGEETVFKAKPARRVVKIRPLKKLKEMAE